MISLLNEDRTFNLFASDNLFSRVQKAENAQTFSPIFLYCYDCIAIFEVIYYNLL